ncbi:SDR family oxidoreductase [Methylobacillus flagellatus]|uniref:SDR family NAD(P)-dependent oxidoreductase n=1 Tax=Methylobacillus flagellatus TaxID=405 RepID=UPI002853E171|nr:SDR family oxidoreductase [Methylobacillus flagellatus]MDR5172032.1 SDR family oxidoreductase [Methylobacillus flagellatus]
MSAAPRRHALITGAAGGIGRALVEAFHAEGYGVIATDIGNRPEWLPQAAIWLAADLARLAREHAYADAFVTEVRKALQQSPLDALVNNAAVQILADTGELDLADWQTTLDVNLTAPFLLVKSLLPELEAAQGAVVNISSIHAAQTKKRFVAYATSKAALSGMTRALAVELGGRIRVNAIEPAAIDTAMLREGFSNDPEGFAQLQAYHPAGRIGQQAEVARLALMLCSNALPFANGSCVALDGGIRGRLHDPD